MVNNPYSEINFLVCVIHTRHWFQYTYGILASILVLYHSRSENYRGTCMFELRIGPSFVLFIFVEVFKKRKNTSVFGKAVQQSHFLDNLSKRVLDDGAK